MSIKEYDLAMFIGDLVAGRYDHFSKLQLAARLAALLPDGTSKTTLQNQIVKALKLDEAIIGAQSKKGE